MYTTSLRLQGFKIIFEFSDNSYFSNKELVKTYYMVSDDAEDPVLQRATGTTIQWASGKNPGVKVSQTTCVLSQLIALLQAAMELHSLISLFDLISCTQVHADAAPRQSKHFKMVKYTIAHGLYTCDTMESNCSIQSSMYQMRGL